MGFRIGYTQLLTLRCWHPGFLGSVAGRVPVAPTDTLTVEELQDYLSYDLREWIAIEPTAAGRATLDRYGWRWASSTLGGWVLVPDTYQEPAPEVRVQLGVRLVDPRFAAATNFGPASLEGQLFHLTNANASPATDATLELTGGNLRPIHYQPSQGFRITLQQNTPATDGQVDLRDPLLSGNPIIRSYPVAGGEAGTTTYQIDLTGIPAGSYRFTGTNINPITLSVGHALQPDLLGTIDLRLAGWSGSAFDIRFAPSNP
jgi:hypothetical protein